MNEVPKRMQESLGTSFLIAMLQTLSLLWQE